MLLSLFLLPPRYKATTEILVKRERADFVVTPDASGTQRPAPAAVSETDLNSEIELMKSQDLLEKVVTICGLQKPDEPIPRWRVAPFVEWSDRIPRRSYYSGAQPARVDGHAAFSPRRALFPSATKIPTPSLPLMSWTYLPIPTMEKHLAVNRPAGTLAFFREQAKQYGEGLKTAEARLSEFSEKDGTVSPAQRKMLDLAEAFGISRKSEGYTGGSFGNLSSGS